MGRGGATDVVLGRLAAEQHDQPDPVACRHADPDGTVCGDAIPGERVAAATGGRLVGPDVDIDGVGFDTRTLRPGQLFVPLVAERDGHEFIAAARRCRRRRLPHVARPATSAARRSRSPTPLRALMDLGAPAADRSPARVVGITGSVGKTSTKDLARAALGGQPAHRRQRAQLQQRAGPADDDPQRPDDTEVLVVEMGMRGFGEIARAVRDRAAARSVSSPGVAEAHTELVGGIDGVARAKARAGRGAARATAWRSSTPMIDRVRAMAIATAAHVRCCSATAIDADVRLRDVVLDELARPAFAVDTPWGRVDVRLKISGRAHGRQRRSRAGVRRRGGRRHRGRRRRARRASARPRCGCRSSGRRRAR